MLPNYDFFTSIIYFKHVSKKNVDYAFCVCVCVCVRACVCVCAHSVMSDSLGPSGLWSARLFSAWNFSGKNSGAGSHSLLRGILPTQESNPCLLPLLHCRWILHPLSHLRSPTNHIKKMSIRKRKEGFSFKSG